MVRIQFSLRALFVIVLGVAAIMQGFAIGNLRQRCWLVEAMMENGRMVEEMQIRRYRELQDENASLRAAIKAANLSDGSPGDSAVENE